MNAIVARVAHTRVALVGALLWSFLPSVATAQEVATLRISLLEAQSRAVMASHRLAEARARAATAEGAIAVRRPPSVR